MVKIQIEIEKYTLDRLSRHINDLIIPNWVQNKDDYVINYLLDELERLVKECAMKNSSDQPDSSTILYRKFWSENRANK